MRCAAAAVALCSLLGATTAWLPVIAGASVVVLTTAAQHSRALERCLHSHDAAGSGGHGADMTAKAKNA